MDLGLHHHRSAHLARDGRGLVGRERHLAGHDWNAVTGEHLFRLVLVYVHFFIPPSAPPAKPCFARNSSSMSQSFGLPISSNS